MKSNFVKGSKVKTIDRIARKIRKGSLAEPIVEAGTVVCNEHFGRIVKVMLDGGELITTKPEYLEPFL